MNVHQWIQAVLLIVLLTVFISFFMFDHLTRMLHMKAIANEFQTTSNSSRSEELSSIKGTTTNTSTISNSTSLPTTTKSITTIAPPLIYYNYTAFEFLVLPRFPKTNYCTQEEVHFVIRSHPKARDQRDFVRRTWGRNQTNHLMFALGTGPSGEVSNETLTESNKYHDMLIIDMIDGYTNLTIKTIATLRWASIYCTKAAVLYNGDPDVAIFPNAMNDFVGNIAQQVPFIFGYCYLNSLPIRDPHSKWFVHESVYKPQIYPVFIAGGGIMYSVSAATKLLNEIRADDAYFGLDDVVVSGVLAERAGVPRVCLSTAHFGYSHLKLNQCWRHPPLIILAVGGFESVQYVLDEVNSGMAKCNETDRTLW